MASVAKRKWQSPDGTKREAWIVRYVDRTGKHRQKTFERKKDADNHRTRVEHEKAASGRIGYVEDRTLRQIAIDYGQHIDRRLDEGQIKRGSHKNIAQALRVSILPRLGKMKVSEISALDIERWYNALRSDDGLAIDTARERLIKLSAMFDYAERRGMAKENPAAKALDNLGKAPKTRIRILSVEEVGHLLRCAQQRRRGQHQHTWYLTNTVINVGAFCALRIGEIFALRLADVDLAQRVIHVRHTINEWDELTEPKTPSSYRTVPMPPHVAELLKGWIGRFYVPNDRELLFRNVLARDGTGAAVGGPLPVSRFNAMYWRPVTVDAGLDRKGDHVHFHALRHFAASWWLNNRLPPAETSKLLGHASPSITLNIYAHALMESAERSTAVDTLAAALQSRASAQGLRTGQNLLEYQTP